MPRGGNRRDHPHQSAHSGACGAAGLRGGERDRRGQRHDRTGLPACRARAAVRVEEGQPVKRGQVLAELDASDYRYGLEAAEAQAGMAQANLEKAQNAARPEELAQARANLDRAEDEYGRYRQLYERKSMAPADFAKVEAAHLAARASMRWRRTAGARKTGLREGRGGAGARAGEAEPQARWPTRGSRRLFPVGWRGGRWIPARWAPRACRCRSIVDLNPANVRVGIPEAGHFRVRSGQAATVVIPSLDGASPGKATVVGVAADPASRTLTAKVAVPEPRRVAARGHASPKPECRAPAWGGMRSRCPERPSCTIRKRPR